ncbi:MULTISPECIES: adenosine kinase [unclassified Oleiphilus]|jgi:sugar/nucleoside kinase (ribokinase family)|uniref:adenosine kinase n=2 Tax=Oleiphilus TaxID=141450 RepID=UPI0007C30047|nr:MULTISPECIES: adenosine kinase [unclassified Oleiphilus]KZY44117.1 sugar kinase [Oleiphilus sp. HI0050]KZY73285.1 sugar kinase [Oleiphilus sp. HI0068]KZY76992.1 sugar kinase [Oleiphilus sp. HI0069]KZY89666.1 sugar kinase [Oleiphilus sp. HI0072]KZY31864.1 sugar kinase [Oleiphilus sp. HI0043]
MQQYHVYGLGAALVDTEIEVTDEFLSQANIEKGLMTLVDETRQAEILELMKEHLVGSKRASGGSACNSIIAASYFGAKTYYSCKVSDDENGLFFQQDTQAAGVTTSDKAHPNGTTGKCLVMITPDAERTMNTFLGVSAELDEAQLDAKAIAQSEYLYIEGYLVTSPSGKQAAIKAREIAEQQGVKTAISLSDPGMVEFFGEGLKEMIGQQVDLLFCNKDEALAWTQSNNIEDAAEKLKETAKSFAITLGKDGALVYDGNEISIVAGVEAKAIDTNGAGDMFAGAFLYAITHDQTFAQAATLANRAAAQVVSQYGPRLRPEQHADLKF